MSAEYILNNLHNYLLPALQLLSVVIFNVFRVSGLLPVVKNGVYRVSGLLPVVILPVFRVFALMPVVKNTNKYLNINYLKPITVYLIAFCLFENEAMIDRRAFFLMLIKVRKKTQ